jgi:Ca-activated chloride channel homolog
MRACIFFAVCCSSFAAFAQGMLLPSDSSLRPLGIKYQRVAAEIIDGTAVTKVEQVFVNAAPRQLEATYVFPLPKGAALQDFSLWINGKKTKGEVLEKQKAADIYEGIVRRLQDPGLLEYVDSDVFRARVFPVPANGEQRVELVFSQVLDFSSGLYQYHYPLGASSRGAPPLQVKQDFTFSALIRSKTPLRSIYSPTHRLGVSRKSESEAVAGLELGAGTDISKDLDLFYTVSDKAVGLNFLSQRQGDDSGFFVALVSPKTELKPEEVVAKRVTFVVDTSGSMMGDRIKLARDAMSYCVQRLNSTDEFNVVRFSTDVESLFDKPQSANAANVQKALAFVKSFEATGGTAIDEAFLRGLKDGEGRGTRPHLMMFITDGNPTVGDTDEADIAKHAQASNTGSRVFTFGVGEDLNARLLDRLAQQGNGTSDFVRDDKEFEVKVSSFYDKISNPVLAEVQLDLSAFGAYDIYPKKLPDLFKGTQLVVMGRYRSSKEGTVVLSGSVNGKKQVFEYRATAAANENRYDFVPRLWAIRKVGYLLEEIRLQGERTELKNEVISLGKKYGIVTPYTSYLVVEDVPLPTVRPQPTPMPRPPPPWRMDDRRRAEAPAKAAPREEFEGVFEGKASNAPAATAPAPQGAGAPAADSIGGLGGGATGYGSGVKLDKAEGRESVLVAKKVRSMKDAEVAKEGEPVRVASGRTFLARAGGWVDAEVDLAKPGKALKVKYLSAAYFAVLKLRPDLKAALALGDRVVIGLGGDKRLIIEPEAGETDEKALSGFLK